MIEDMQVIIFAEGAVNRNMDHPRQIDAHIHKIPFRAVVGDRNHLGTRFESQGQEAIRHRMGDFVVLINTVLDPFPPCAAGQDVILGRIALEILEQIEGAQDFHSVTGVLQKFRYAIYKKILNP